MSARFFWCPTCRKYTNHWNIWDGLRDDELWKCYECGGYHKFGTIPEQGDFISHDPF